MRIAGHKEVCPSGACQRHQVVITGILGETYRSLRIGLEGDQTPHQSYVSSNLLYGHVGSEFGSDQNSLQLAKKERTYHKLKRAFEP